jgi:hypothetical protein
MTKYGKNGRRTPPILNACTPSTPQPNNPWWNTSNEQWTEIPYTPEPFWTLWRTVSFHGIKSRLLCCVVRSLITVMTELPGLLLNILLNYNISCKMCSEWGSENEDYGLTWQKPYFCRHTNVSNKTGVSISLPNSAILNTTAIFFNNWYLFTKVRDVQLGLLCATGKPWIGRKKGFERLKPQTIYNKTEVSFRNACTFYARVWSSSNGNFLEKLTVTPHLLRNLTLFTLFRPMHLIPSHVTPFRNFLPYVIIKLLSTPKTAKCLFVIDSPVRVRVHFSLTHAFQLYHRLSLLDLNTDNIW